MYRLTDEVNSVSDGYSIGTAFFSSHRCLPCGYPTTGAMAQASKTTEAVPLPDAASDHGSLPWLSFRRPSPTLPIAVLIDGSTLVCIQANGECLTAALRG